MNVSFNYDNCFWYLPMFLGVITMAEQLHKNPTNNTEHIIRWCCECYKYNIMLILRLVGKYVQRALYSIFHLTITHTTQFNTCICKWPTWVPLTSLTASGVTSRWANPVPPVVRISCTSSPHHSINFSRMSSWSSGTQEYLQTFIYHKSCIMLHSTFSVLSSTI